MTNTEDSNGETGSISGGSVVGTVVVAQSGPVLQTSSMEANGRKTTIVGSISLPSFDYKTTKEESLERYIESLKALLAEAGDRERELQRVVHQQQRKLTNKEKESEDDGKLEEKQQHIIEFLSDDSNDGRLFGNVG